MQLKKVREIRLLTGMVFGLALFLIPSFKSHWLTLVTVSYWSFVFPFLVYKSRKVVRSIKYLEGYLAFLNRQISKQKGIVESGFYQSHTEKNELNITGPNSLYDFINEFWSFEASEKVAEQLSSQIISEKEINQRQRWIQAMNPLMFQLAKLRIQMQHFNPKGFRIQKAFEDLAEIKKPQKIEFVTVGIWVLFVGSGIASLLGFIPSSVPFWFLTTFWILQIISVQSRGMQFFRALDIESAMKSLMPCFKLVKKAPDLKLCCPEISKTNLVKKFRRIQIYSNLLSIETHILATLIANALLPYHIFVSWGLSASVKPFLENKEVFAKEMIDLDILSSLVFLFSYHTQTFPSFSEQLQISANKIYLPLISRQKVVKNDFHMGGDQKITLITGSNMSGKSTFLRTLAQNQALALLGAPVFADSYQTVYAPIQSCINITDSVMMSYSYFLSEVKKLKEIYESVKSHKTIYFLDELFRGTNQKERIIAARSYLLELGKYQSLGFITTHDKEITELSDKSNIFKTCYFEEDFGTDDISFSYKVKEGVANSTNALRILKREGLPVYEG